MLRSLVGSEMCIRDRFYTAHDPLSSQGAAQRFFNDDDDDESGSVEDDLNTNDAASLFGDGEGDMDLSNTIDLTGLMEDDQSAHSPTPTTARAATSPPASVVDEVSNNHTEEDGDGEEDASVLYGELNTSNVHLHAQEELRRLKVLREAQLNRRRR
eukprot:TRINITY_DN12909_c0_g1_i2.p1 TRINITY_DN12909_c0_g1~~TRINITY_DN12909_c0_g1_i2.p1  ORF type:complete len:156 (-),score=50.00 TRINITY_DN12909_c0_g1_i2:172-639(-)